MIILTTILSLQLHTPNNTNFSKLSPALKSESNIKIICCSGLCANNLSSPIKSSGNKSPLYDRKEVMKDLKERLKKAQDMAKKNENKVFIKKPKINPIIKTINGDKERVKSINDDTKVQYINFNTLVKELHVFEGNNFQEYLKENKDKYKNYF